MAIALKMMSSRKGNVGCTTISSALNCRRGAVSILGSTELRPCVFCKLSLAGALLTALGLLGGHFAAWPVLCGPGVALNRIGPAVDGPLAFIAGSARCRPSKAGTAGYRQATSFTAN